MQKLLTSSRTRSKRIHTVMFKRFLQHAQATPTVFLILLLSSRVGDKHNPNPFNSHLASRLLQPTDPGCSLYFQLTTRAGCSSDLLQLHCAQHLEFEGHSIL